jgi:hypothetical protein
MIVFNTLAYALQPNGAMNLLFRRVLLCVAWLVPASAYPQHRFVAVMRDAVFAHEETPSCARTHGHSLPVRLHGQGDQKNNRNFMSPA